MASFKGTELGVMRNFMVHFLLAEQAAVFSPQSDKSLPNWERKQLDDLLKERFGSSEAELYGSGFVIPSVLG